MELYPVFVAGKGALNYSLMAGTRRVTGDYCGAAEGCIVAAVYVWATAVCGQ